MRQQTRTPSGSRDVRPIGERLLKLFLSHMIPIRICEFSVQSRGDDSIWSVRGRLRMICIALAGSKIIFHVLFLDEGHNNSSRSVAKLSDVSLERSLENCRRKVTSKQLFPAYRRSRPSAEGRADNSGRFQGCHRHDFLLSGFRFARFRLLCCCATLPTSFA